MTIHAEHCRCSLCEPNRRRAPHSGKIFALAIAASAILAIFAIFWLSQQVHDLMLTTINL